VNVLFDAASVSRSGDGCPVVARAVAPQMLTRYGASARRAYGRIMTSNP
jgi:hypothetical protein